MPRPLRWRLNNFSAGLDRAAGLVTEEQSHFYDLTNYRVVNPKKISRRPPQRLAGAISNCQGLIAHRGTLYTVAQAGTAATLPTVPGHTVTAVSFDIPDHCISGDWELLELVEYNGHLCALIDHGYDGATGIDNRYALHVFDDLADLPTFVSDPACPTNWAPALPQHWSGRGINGAITTYRPRMAVVNGRLLISRPDGNVQFSAISRPRAWNEHTLDDLIENGRPFIFLKPSGNDNSFYLPISWADYSGGAYYGIIVDVLATNGEWRTFVESETTTGSSGIFIVEGATPSWSSSARVKVTVNHAGTEPIIRIRVILFGENPIVITAPAPALATDSWARLSVGAGGSWLGNGSGTIEAFTVAEQNLLSSLVPSMFTAFTGRTGEFLLKLYAGHGDGTIPYDILGVPDNRDGTFLVSSLPMGTLGMRQRVTKRVIVYGVKGVTTTAGAFGGVNTTVQLSINVTNGDFLIIQSVLGAVLRYKAGSTTGLGGNAIILNSAGVAGDYTADWNSSNQSVWLISAANAITLDTFTYGVETVSGRAYYDQISLDLQLNWIGADDAGFIPTSAQQQGGQTVTMLAAVKDRVLVSYQLGTQLWLMPADVALHQLLDAGPVGTGEQVLPWPQIVDGVVLVAMARGIRGMSLSGQEMTSLRDSNLGEAIEDLGYPQQAIAGYWPHLGMYLTQATIGGANVFLCLDLSREQKIRAWSQWTIASAAMSSVETNSLAIIDRQAYWRMNGQIHYFDADDTVYEDDADGATPFESVWKSHFNDLREPYRTKHVFMVEAIHSGAATVEIFSAPQLETQGNGAVTLPNTLHARSVPVAAWGQAIAIEIRSTDVTGHVIEEIGLQYRLLGRG